MADVWDSSLPYTDTLASEKTAYCDANDLGDWADGADPWDLSQYGTPTYEEDTHTEYVLPGYVGDGEATGVDWGATCALQDSGLLTSGEMQTCYGMEQGYIPDER